MQTDEIEFFEDHEVTFEESERNYFIQQRGTKPTFCNETENQTS